MEYGNVVLANSKGELLASVIKWITGSTWSHSLFTLPNCCGREMAIEAASIGVSCLPFDTGYRLNNSQGYRVYRVKVAQEVMDVAIAKSLDDLETFYGYLDLPWFVWRAVNRLFGRDIKNQDNWAYNNKICSQLVVDYLIGCGLQHIFNGYGRNAICPQDLQVIMDSHPEHFDLIETKE
jgi:hypothetical protein